MVYIHPSTNVDILTLSAKNTNSLILGGPAAEGGNILGYRDSSGNTGFSVDMDAASGSKGLYSYAGGVFETNVTIGQNTLSTTSNLYVSGSGVFTTKLQMGITTLNTTYPFLVDIPNGYSGKIEGYNASAALLTIINTNGEGLYITAKAGANILNLGAIHQFTNTTIGFFSVTPQTQQAHIIDADGNLADITTKFNTLLADLEGYGLLLTS